MRGEKLTFKLEKIVEISSWAVMILILFGVRFLPQNPIGNAQTYYLIGVIVSFALLYYLVIYRYFSKTNRLYLKSIADIILIGVLIHLLKDYNQYLYALYFLPIAAAALSLQLFNALLVATLASLFVVFEIYLGSQGILPHAENSNLFQGVWEVAFILFITIFCRFLAIQIRQEQHLKQESLDRQKVLEEESVREKEFLSLTSHQLNTPLSIIRGFSSMLESEKLGKLDSKQKEAVAEIYNSSKRMAALIDELLAISRIQSGTLELKKEETNLEEFLNNIVYQLNKTKELEHQEIKLNLLGSLDPVKIDHEKIRQVLYNLLNNALKYTRSGAINLEAKQNENETIFTVKDNGIGIRPEDMEKIFQPFFRGKNILELDNKGTGLGLYISKLLVEEHGGKIWLEETKNGATFSFSIPK